MPVGAGLPVPQFPETELHDSSNVSTTMAEEVVIITGDMLGPSFISMPALSSGDYDNDNITNQPLAAQLQRTGAGFPVSQPCSSDSHDGTFFDTCYG